ncbi:MAG: DUF1772 domain-containing protein [Pseudonocardiaceae bacterium]
MLAALRGTSLVAATVTMGLVAGLFFAFAMSVMPGLGRTGATTLVDAMQQINVAILNPWLAISLGGAPVCTLVAAALHLQSGRRAVLLWIVAAFVLYLVALGVTVGVNIPLNDALAAAGPPERIPDLAAVRDSFEAAWVRWNIIRAVASTAAFSCLTLALLRSGS